MKNRNQFGVRFGGPIIKNKTFFFVLVDEQRDIIKQTFVGTVLTPLARQGIFRFFPGADNQNTTQNNPTVDRNGNPVKPANATGDLQQFSVFTRPMAPRSKPAGIRSERFHPKTRACENAAAERLHGWRRSEYGGHSLHAPHLRHRLQ